LDAAEAVSGPDDARDLARRTAKDYLVYLPSLVVPGLVNLALVPYLTRRFPADQYGNYVLAMGLYQTLPTIFSLWIDHSILRFISRYRSRPLAFLRVVAVALFLISLIVVSVGLLVLRLWMPGSDELHGFYTIAVLAFPVRALFDACHNYFRGAGLSLAYSLVRIARVLGMVGLGLALTLGLSWDIRAFLVGSVVTELVLSLIGVSIAARHALIQQRTHDESACTDIAIESSGKMVRMMASYGLPMAGLNLAATVLSIGDRYILEYHFGSAVVGVYNAGYVVPEALLRLVSLSITTAVAPIFFERWEQRGEQGTLPYLSHLLRAYAYMAVPLWLIMLLFRSPIRLLTSPGAQYEPVTNLMPIIAFALLLHGFTLILNIEFSSRLKSHLPFINAVISAGVNLALNLILVPIAGIMGAAISTVVAYTLMLVLTVLGIQRRSRMHFRINRMRPLVAASIGLALTGIGMWELCSTHTGGIRLALSGVAGAIVYSGIVIATDRDWRAVASSAAHRVRGAGRRRDRQIPGIEASSPEEGSL
jgi:O-antigen/teichoic acid export membrane protein